VLLLHGWHQSCYLPGTEQSQTVWPCPQGWEPLPSHLGYRYLQRLLASQGYVTVSISANAVNGQDIQEVQASPDLGVTARAALVRRHLSEWARWTSDPASPWSERVDMDEVTLIGHSRGGEAVNRAAISVPASAPYAINGLVLIAPTDFGRQAAPGVSTVTLLGYCDGDVTGLDGQGYADVGRDFVRDSALRSSVLVMGANHNYFNTEWTPGVAAAFAETTGATPTTRSVAPTHRLGCQPQSNATSPPRTSPERSGCTPSATIGCCRCSTAHRSRCHLPARADVRTTAVGGRRRLVAVREGMTVLTAGPIEARTCAGQSSGPASVCGAGLPSERTPHWPVGNQSPYRPGQPALELSWTGASGAATLRLDRRLDLSRSTSVDARVIVSTGTPLVRLGLRLVDADGASVVLQPRDHGRLAGTARQ
jgi:hypothetical protein